MKVLVISFFLLAGVSSQADVNERYFELASMEVSEETPPSQMMSIDRDCDSSEIPSLRPDSRVQPYFDGITLDQIVNMGKQVWAIIKKNQPSVNLKVERADALPSGVNAWDDLECWQTPESRIFRAVYKNAYGMEVVNVAFRVNYTHGGRIAGQGRYLSQVTVLPAELNVLWGFKLDGEVRVANVTNAGTKSRPIGAIQLDVNWTIRTPFKYSETTETFYVRGDGFFKQLQ